MSRFWYMTVGSVLLIGCGDNSLGSDPFTSGTAGGGGSDDANADENGGGDQSDNTSDDNTSDDNEPQPCAGVACTEDTPACVESGIVFCCKCGLMLPFDADVTCVDDQDGAGGAGGGGNVTTGTASSSSSSSTSTSSSSTSGSSTSTSSSSSTSTSSTSTSSSSSSSSGAGGAGGGMEGGCGEGGMGGGATSTSSSSSTSTSSSSTSSSSSSSSGSSSSSSTSGGVPVAELGTLKVTIVPQEFGTHSLIRIVGDEKPFRMGGVTFDKPDPSFTVTNATRLVATIAILQGSKFVFNGATDPTVNDPKNAQFWVNQMCDPTTFKSNVAVWATFTLNGVTKPTAHAEVKTNNQGGCNIEIVAAASPLISASDTDGDGSTPAQGDCNDSPNGGEAFFPAQVESPDDMNDLNCNGAINPGRQIVRLLGVPSGRSPVLHDSHTGNVYAMTWKPASNVYETAPIEMKNSVSEGYITWPGNDTNFCFSGTCYDSGFWDGVCHDGTGGVQSYRDTDMTLAPVSLTKVQNQATCHRFVDPALLKP